MRQLNGRFLLILTGVMVLSAGSVFLIHRAQSGRIARALLRQAKRAEEQSRLDLKMKFLGRYLEFRPKDNAVRAELGQTLASPEVAVTHRGRERALFVLEQVLLHEPDRQDSRRQLVRIAMQLGRQDVAREHLKTLETQLPNDGDVFALLGQWHEARREFPQAVAQFRRAIQLAPQETTSYVRLAQALRRLPEPDRKSENGAAADQVMDELIAANAESFQAYLARWQYRREFQDLKAGDQLAEAGKDVDRAVELAPEEVGVLRAAADLAQLRGDRNTARQYLRRGIELQPKEAALYQALAHLELQDPQPEQRRKKAVECLQQGIKAVPTGPAQGDLVWTLANLQIDEGELTDAEASIEQLRRARSSPQGVDYLTARVLIRKGQWGLAARMLERTRPLLTNAPELTRHVDLLLGRCYEQLDEPGRQLTVFQRMVTRDPRSLSARQGLAGTLWAAGRLDDALEQYRQLMTLPDAPADGWTQMARLLLVRTLQRQPRDWKEAEDALQRAEQTQPQATEVVLLRSELLLAQGKPERARELLTQARDRQPKQIAWWTALASLAERQDQPGDALQLLKEAERQCGDSIELRLAWIRYWSGRGDEEGQRYLAVLAEEKDGFREEDRVRLRRGLTEAYCRLRRFTQAAVVWGRLAAEPQYAGDLRAQLLWFDLALQAGEDAMLDKVSQSIQRIEQGQGPLWHYAQALRLIRKGRQGDRQSLDEARTHLDAAAARRPGWPALLLARARVEDLRGNPDQAVAGYRRAIELGENGPEVIRELVRVLHRSGRGSEADPEVRRLEKQGTLSPELQRLAADIALHSQDPARAARLALQAVADDSSDYLEYLWLGQILAAREPGSKEAEAKFRRAVELGGEAPETWVALVRFLTANNRLKEAETAVEQAKAKLPAKQAALALAQCQEALNQPEEAVKQYQSALSEQPGDSQVVRSAASFYLRAGRLREAEPLLRRLMDRQVKVTDIDAAWARRSLALAVANHSDYRRFPEALALVGLRLEGESKVIEERKLTEGEAVEELRTRARVLVTTNRRALRRHAVGFLEELARRQSLNPDDQLLLAQLYEADGQWPKAREQLRGLATGPGAYPLTLAHVARSLLRHNEGKEAGGYIDWLEQAEKNRQVEAGQFGSVELRAQLLELTGKPLEAVELLRQHAQKEGAPPETALQLAGCLARQDRVVEALDICEKVWARCPPEAVGGASVSVVRSARSGAAQVARVERLLQDAIQKQPKNSLLLLHLADVRDLQERYEDAVALYRQVLKQEEGNVVALNNLAWLLAQKPDGAAEALTLINQAIQLVGPRAELLDTRAVVHLAQQRTDRAIADLEQSNAEAPNSQRYFHLARAHLLAKDSESAAAFWKKAKASGLEPAQLHPVERVAYRKMADDLK